MKKIILLALTISATLTSCGQTTPTKTMPKRLFEKEKKEVPPPQIIGRKVLRERTSVRDKHHGGIHYQAFPQKYVLFDDGTTMQIEDPSAEIMLIEKGDSIVFYNGKINEIIFK
ncbi:MAG: hypothetical protein R3Y43_00980 [Alphaproteobacteria bacterium]